VGCGRIAPKAELVRIALAEMTGEASGGARRRAVLDRAGRMQGRGAYVCMERGGEPARVCLAHAASRGGIARTLRCAVEIDPELIESVSP
jgi:predicted RNA-binding protein YlxR (DUF448 family)